MMIRRGPPICCEKAWDCGPGPAYADMQEDLALAPEIARLEDLRVLALGDRIDADLALGRHGSLIGELEGLTYEFPIQERFQSAVHDRLVSRRPPG